MQEGYSPPKFITPSKTLTVTNSTITGNTTEGFGGGINNGPDNTVTTTNTIVAGNTASISAPNLSGPITTGGHNLFGTTSGATITLAPSDLVNPNPLLGPLGNNGGPTQTVPLLSGSPAIDAGDDTVCAGVAVGNKDQRGATRPFGAHCDIGAFEYQVVNPLPGAKPTAPAAGNPPPLPPARPAGSAQGSPNPLPPARP